MRERKEGAQEEIRSSERGHKVKRTPKRPIGLDSGIVHSAMTKVAMRTRVAPLGRGQTPLRVP